MNELTSPAVDKDTQQPTDVVDSGSARAIGTEGEFATRTVIGADALGRDFGTKSVLQDVTFEVPQGRICALLGKNGSGKTTLLKLLYGLIEPTRGHSQLLSDTAWPRSAEALKQTGCVLDGFEPPGGTRLRHLLDLSAAAGPSFELSRARELLESHKLRP